MEHQKKDKNTFFIIAIVVIGALFIFAFAQTMQVNALKTEIKQTQGASPTPQASANQQAPVAQTPVTQPTMVGGC